ncbi:class I SAM-dependent methyltransferase [Granulosicoccus antarcticus]|uniref:class I SAM-dependent methyltransferase n=1 Tax=Granulosicoccus antarcticus TaxID=437505 RepID=UPI0012FE0691|nr:class I SAM-dependent methyltransferase [Granulosicoccus antarcticus]
MAIDCGCGAGRDTAFLLGKGFTVHAFDKELEAVEFCQKRFESNGNFHATQACFSDFHYPPASLVMAHASLFFCPDPPCHQYAIPSDDVID